MCSGNTPERLLSETDSVLSPDPVDVQLGRPGFVNKILSRLMTVFVPISHRHCLTREMRPGCLYFTIQYIFFLRVFIFRFVHESTSEIILNRIKTKFPF